MSAAEDQAAGLRRLFDARPCQWVALAAADGKSGRTPLVVQTALALAEAGERVVLIDEHGGSKTATQRLGAAVQGDMWDSLIGRLALERLIAPVAANLWLLTAATLAQRVQQDNPVMREKLGQIIGPLRQSAAFVLTDAALAPGGGLPLLSSMADHLVLVTGAETANLTASYGLIKRLALERGRERFHVVVTRARSEALAQKVFDNLSRTAANHLGVRLEWLAAVRAPTAESLAEELYSRLPLRPAAYDDAAL